MKYGKIEKAVSIDVCDQMVDVIDNIGPDLEIGADQNPVVLNSVSGYYGLFNSVQLQIKPIIEEAFGYELIPTYNVSTVYYNGSVLVRHTDRKACECSVTLNLKNEKDLWDIWLWDKKNGDPTAILLEPGDLAWYKGCEVEHWREKNMGGKVYQAFFHYVRKGGDFERQAYDKNKEDWEKNLNNPMFAIDF